MGRPSLRQLEYLQLTVELGSFSAVARKLHVTQAAISSALSDLEKLLKVKLFTRAPGFGVVPTESAERMAVDISHILRGVDDLSAKEVADGESLTGTVKVGCIRTFSAQFVPAITQILQQRHPHLHLEIIEGDPKQLVLLDRLGQTDLTLVYDRQLQGHQSVQTLGYLKPHLVFARSSRFAERESVSLMELVDEPLVTFDIEPVRHRIVSLVLGVTGVMPDVLMTPWTPETLYSIVARDLGYAIAYMSPLSAVSYEGDPLSYVPITEELTLNRLVALTPKVPGANVRAALDAVKYHIEFLKNLEHPGVHIVLPEIS